MASAQMQQQTTAGRVQPKHLLTSAAESTASVALPVVAVEAPPAEPIYGTVIPNRVFVGGISRDTTETDLMVAFSAYGTVRSTKIIVDQDGFNKGYGFVTFETEAEAQRLQLVGKCVILRNRRLNIAPAFKKQQQQLRPKLQPIIETNGTVYFTAQPPPPPPPPPSTTTVNAMPIEQYRTTSYAPAGQVAQVAQVDYATAQVPTIYQQAPAGVQYQPVYQYYSVPVNVPAVWPQNYYQDPQATNSQTSIPQPTAWEFDGANSINSWRTS